jgi:hypothetical protein
MKSSLLKDRGTGVLKQINTSIWSTNPIAECKKSNDPFLLVGEKDDR